MGRLCCVATFTSGSRNHHNLQKRNSWSVLSAPLSVSHDKSRNCSAWRHIRWFASVYAFYNNNIPNWLRGSKSQVSGLPLALFTRNFWFNPIYETRLTWVNGGFHWHHTNADENRHQHEPIRILHDLKQNKHPVQFPFHLICVQCVQSDVIHSMRNNSL